jgi:glutamate transport system permease protein
MSAQSVLFDAPGPRARRFIAVANVVGVLLVLAIAWFIYVKFDEKGQWAGNLWSKAFAADSWQYYLWPGLQNTLLAAVYSVVAALVFGFLFGIGRLSTNRAVRWFCGVVVEFFRAVPVLVMMFAGWLIFSRQLDWLIPRELAPLYAVVVALTLYNGSVIAELIRSGVGNLPKGQREAALAVGMTRGQSIRNVELPQAIVAMLPSLVSQFVVILKDSALGSLITFAELLKNAQTLTSGGGLLQVLIVVAAVYIVINWLLSKLAERLARGVRRRTSGRTKAETPGGAVGPAPTTS